MPRYIEKIYKGLFYPLNSISMSGKKIVYLIINEAGIDIYFLVDRNRSALKGNFIYLKDKGDLDEISINQSYYKDSYKDNLVLFISGYIFGYLAKNRRQKPEIIKKLDEGLGQLPLKVIMDDEWSHRQYEVTGFSFDGDDDAKKFKNAIELYKNFIKSCLMAKLTDATDLYCYIIYPCFFENDKSSRFHEILTPILYDLKVRGEFIFSRTNMKMANEWSFIHKYPSHSKDDTVYVYLYFWYTVVCHVQDPLDIIVSPIGLLFFLDEDKKFGTYEDIEREISTKIRDGSKNKEFVEKIFRKGKEEEHYFRNIMKSNAVFRVSGHGATSLEGAFKEVLSGKEVMCTPLVKDIPAIMSDVISGGLSPRWNDLECKYHELKCQFGRYPVGTD